MGEVRRLTVDSTDVGQGGSVSARVAAVRMGSQEAGFGSATGVSVWPSCVPSGPTQVIEGASPDQSIGAQGQHPLTDATILVVEDDEDIADILEVWLMIEGATVLVARTGGEGLNLAHERMPDLILLDMDLPDMDGLTVASELKSSLTTCNIPAVATTARTEPGDQERCLQAGGCDYVSKPFEFDVLRRAMERAVS